MNYGVLHELESAIERKLKGEGLLRLEIESAMSTGQRSVVIYWTDLSFSRVPMPDLARYGRHNISEPLELLIDRVLAEASVSSPASKKRRAVKRDASNRIQTCTALRRRAQHRPHVKGYLTHG